MLTSLQWKLYSEFFPDLLPNRLCEVFSTQNAPRVCLFNNGRLVARIARRDLKWSLRFCLGHNMWRVAGVFQINGFRIAIPRTGADVNILIENLIFILKILQRRKVCTFGLLVVDWIVSLLKISESRYIALISRTSNIFSSWKFQ